MKKLSRKIIFEVLVLVIVGLTPILWFHDGNQLILGHDAGLTLNPVPHFFDRLFLWTERYGFGNDQAYALPGFFIHGLEAIVTYLGASIQLQQKLTFIFWFMLPGMTMYYFASRLAKKLELEFFALPVSLLYMFNHFLLQGWLIAERTKFSVYAALPIVMVFLYDWAEGKRSTLKTSIFISVTLFFLNGTGSLPLFGGLIVVALAFVIFHLLSSFSLEKILGLLKLFILTIGISVALHAYWLLPYLQFVATSFQSAVSQAGGESGVLGWLEYISRNSSLVNLFRLQGIPDWYNNPYHPYANEFLKNPFLILVGLLLPVFAFLPLLIYKDKKKRFYIIFFSFLALFSLIFIGGSHPPFGAIYVFLFKFVPGFIAFRTPFYKFAPALWFAYAILIGFTISYFIQKLNIKKKVLSVTFYVAICAGIILYSYPFLTGSFFDYWVGERSTKVEVPNYVYDFGKFSEAPGRLHKRTLLLPPQSNNFRADVYKWGYWSLTPLTSLLTNASFVSINGGTPKDEGEIIDSLYQKMRQNDPSWPKVAKLLGIESFLLRKDFVWEATDTPTDNPLIYEKVLANSQVKKAAEFGEWVVYDFVDESSITPRVGIFQSLSYVVGAPKDISTVVSLSTFPQDQPFYISGSAVTDESVLMLASNAYIKPECINCLQQSKYINPELFTPSLIRGSIFYPFIEIQNKNEEEKIQKKSTQEKLDFYLYKSLEDVLALQKLVDEKGDTAFVVPIVQDYVSSLSKLKKELKAHVAEIDNAFLIESIDVIRTQESTFLGKSANILDAQTIEEINQAYDLIIDIKKVINGAVWQTDDTEKRFLVNVPIGQEYQLLYRPNDFSLGSLRTLEYLVDGKKYSSAPTASESGWMSLGANVLEKGIHRIEITQPSVNLYSGPTTVEVALADGGECFFMNPIRAMENEMYKISFKHRRLEGTRNLPVRIKKDASSAPIIDFKGDVLGVNYFEENYGTFHRVGKNEDVFYVALCSDPTTDTNSVPSVVELKDIVIQKVAVPDLVLYSDSGKEKSAVKFDYTRSSQTEYIVNADLKDNQKYILAMNGSSNDNWELSGMKGEKFVINGHANGWILDGDGTNGTIKYKTQGMVVIGFAITALSIIILLTVALINLYVGKNKK